MRIIFIGNDSKGRCGTTTFVNMKILSWNCRGLGTSWTISYLREIYYKHRPEFLFLSETKQNFEFVQSF